MFDLTLSLVYEISDLGFGPDPLPSFGPMSLIFLKVSLNGLNIAGFREKKNARSHSERKNPKLVASISESRVNPVAESLN